MPAEVTLVWRAGSALGGCEQMGASTFSYAHLMVCCCHLQSIKRCFGFASKKAEEFLNKTFKNFNKHVFILIFKSQ